MTSAPDSDGSAVHAGAGRHLVDVHDHLRRELDQVKELVAKVVAGARTPGLARSDLNVMTMRQNNWTLGVYCQSYCRVVTGHHGLEDSSIFPHLRRSNPQLEPVIDRLQAEHRTIHDVLEGVDRALVTFVSEPDGSAVLESAVEALSDSLLTHLAYEEQQLVGPLDRFGFY
ncbi:MAG: hemerythrin domain-containing protein [Nocardioidaceae bacterium]